MLAFDPKIEVLMAIYMSAYDRRVLQERRQAYIEGNSFRQSLTLHAVSVLVSTYLLKYWTPLNIRGAFIVGACAEVSAIVARIAIRCFTDNKTILRVFSPTARFVGGYYLGNMAMIALRFQPMPFIAATAAIMLPTLLVQLFTRSISSAGADGCL